MSNLYIFFSFCFATEFLLTSNWDSVCTIILALSSQFSPFQVLWWCFPNFPSSLDYQNCVFEQSHGTLMNWRWQFMEQLRPRVAPSQWSVGRGSACFIFFDVLFKKLAPSNFRLLSLKIDNMLLVFINFRYWLLSLFLSLKINNKKLRGCLAI